MMALRVGYGLALALSLVGGLASGLRVYYLTFFSLLFLLVAALGLNLWTYLSFSYVQKLDRRGGVKGGTACLRVGVYNDKPFPFTRMRVQVEMADPKDRPELKIELKPREDVQFDLSLSLPYRGDYLVGMTYLYVQDLFGLCPLRFDLRRLAYYRQLPLTVYPYLVRLPELGARLDDGKEFAAFQLLAAENGENYAFARPYRRGDARNRVHWKLSMRQRELLVRQYDTPLEQRCVVVVDNGPNGLAGEEALRYADAACECAAALVRRALSSGHPVTLVHCGLGAPLDGKGPEDFAAFYEALAHLPFGKGSGCAQALRQAGQAETVYAVTRKVDEALRWEMDALGARVTVVLLGEGAAEDPRVLKVRDGRDLAAAMGGGAG